MLDTFTDNRFGCPAMCLEEIRFGCYVIVGVAWNFSLSVYKQMISYVFLLFYNNDM